MSSEVDANYYEVVNEKVKANCGWITKEFLQDVISGHEGNEDTRVVGSEAKAVVGVGDNYCSLMYQMSADCVNEKTGKRETRRFVIKGLPSAKILRNMIEEYGIFQKELYVYNVCLPVMRRIMAEYMPDETDFIAAESYTCHLPNVVVLEDLKVSGYKMADRREQLDFQHTAVAVRSLARFHALSVRLVKAKPEVAVEVTRDELYGDRTGMMSIQTKKAVKSWMKVMSQQETTKHLVPIMEKAAENILEKVIHAIEKRDSSFLALNHGDSWTNNFMYKYDEDGNVVHAKMVDFQITRYSCPVLDIIYFLFSSPQPEMLEKRFEEIIKIYHEALISDMKQLCLDPSEMPALEDIRREMRERSVFGIIAMIIVTPIVLAKPSDCANLEDVDQSTIEKSEDYFLENNFRDPLYREVVVKYVAIMEKMGYLKSAAELVVPPTTNGK